MLPFDDIRECTNFLFDNIYFTFQNIIYKQKAGTPIGGGISQKISDLVMEDLEKSCLSRLKNEFNIKPVFYYRYVDDTILCIPNGSVDIVLDVFNSYHNSLQFTCETEENKCLNFLDVTLIRENNSITSDWFQKPTFSGRIMNFDSNHPKYMKQNIIYNLVDRSTILAHKKFHSKNLQCVRKLLIENGYPTQFISNCIQKRIHCNNNTDNPLRKKALGSAYARQNFVSIPYCHSFFKKCSVILKKFNIRAVPKVNKGLSKIVKLGKDTLNKLQNTNVVYEM